MTSSAWLRIEEKAKIISGELNPFGGPIKYDAGTETVTAGTVMPDKTFSSLNWYVEGVEGSVPK
jgi:basic membrane protein A and related proteins